MHCAACVARVDRALAAVPGVELATVNLATRQAKVKFNPRLTNPAALTKVITDAGYEVEGTSQGAAGPPLPGSGGQRISPALPPGPGPEPAGVALHDSPGGAGRRPQPPGHGLRPAHLCHPGDVLLRRLVLCRGLQRRPAPVHQHGHPGGPGHLRRLLLLRLGHLLPGHAWPPPATPRRSTTTPR